MPQRVTISQRSRPLRFGYLLRGFYDRRGFRAGIRLFTSLWGGMYNCFIPVYSHRPKWWKGSQSGPEITRGYIDAFEPDFLVTEDSEWAEGLDYEKSRILLRSDLIGQVRHTPFSHGIGVHELFDWMWEEDFQYVRREPPEIVVPQPAEPGLGPLIETCFGAYPDRDDRRPDFESKFRHVFDAEDLIITGDQFLRLQRDPGIGYPLNLGVAHLEVPRRGGPLGPLLFFLDPGSTCDLVDYWNLRAFGMDSTVVPLPWFNELKGGILRTARAAHRPHPINPGRILATTAFLGQSQDTAKLQALVDSLNADPPGSIRSGSYPCIWAKGPRFVYRPRRGRVVASRGETEVTLRGEQVTFHACSLPFKAARSAHRKADSVRVIQVRDWSGSSGVAVAFPPDLKSAKTVVESFPMHEVWSSSEGIVTTCEGAQPRFYWRLPKSRDVCGAWLEQHGFTFEVTSAGKLLEEAVRRLGGLHGVWLLAGKKLVDLLNSMAGRPDQPAKTCTGSELVESIKQTTGDRVEASNILHRLIHSRVLDLGAKLQCEHCGQHNWYRLEALSTTLYCHRCLQDFSFPVDHPPNNPWRYRTVGPFAVENYIMGGVPVLLSLPLLGSRGGSFPLAGMTWCPSFELKRNGEDWGEVDALAFVEQSQAHPGSVLPAFVEAKSYGGKDGIFKPEDTDRMRDIGENFRGAVLVFATLGFQLTNAEKELIRPVAEAGREPIEDDHWLNPVVVLTGHELFSEAGPPYCWDGVPGAADIRRRFRSTGSLLDLADATQQLHLGMEPYHEYIGRWIGNRYKT